MGRGKEGKVGVRLCGVRMYIIRVNNGKFVLVRVDGGGGGMI